MKKYDSYKLCHKVEFRSVFHAQSQKFKILAIPNIISHGKSYEHNFVNKCYSHKLCAKLSFDQFFEHHLKNLKYWSFPTYFEHSHVQSRVLISFLCTIFEVQNSGHSQHISPWEVVRVWFYKKSRWSKLCAKSRVKSSFV
ncbi:hypothetical protein B296_00000282 [Ensete ventricosum]|uniref:Uncharacterized protein n=1 Tax=Ensete ventricosum TaxID=4639 RepID=A0A426ZP74_ENSVE|nr:hypothetical protein B296_00000282 [Ensete ventricosum]